MASIRGIWGQLVAFENWVGILRQHFDIPNIYFQDPTFNSLDRAFLTSLGFEVIESSQRNNVLIRESFLYIANASRDVQYVSLKIDLPAILVGKKLLWRRDAEKQALKP